MFLAANQRKSVINDDGGLYFKTVINVWILPYMGLQKLEVFVFMECTFKREPQ